MTIPSPLPVMSDVEPPPPHARWIEAVTAFVTLKPGASATETELVAHCKTHLGDFEVPKAIRVLDTLPMTTTGKVQKHPLRERHSDLYTR